MNEIEKKVREHYHLQMDGENMAEVQIIEEDYENIPQSVLKELEQEEITTLEAYAKE